MATAKPERDKRKPVEFFLDMDGVLTRWWEHAEQACAHIPEDEREEYYHQLGRTWWNTIPMHDGARALYDGLASLSSVRFLTGVKRNPGGYSGKADWLMNTLAPDMGVWILRDYIICASTDKNLLGAPGRILVDDMEENIRKWEEAGGIGIFHTGDIQDTLQRAAQAYALASAGVVPPRASSAPQVYLDVDNVLAAYSEYLVSTGVEISPEGLPDFDRLTHDWWASIPLSPDARTLYDQAAARAPSRFLTAAYYLPECYSGKADWIMNKFLPEKGREALKDLIICPAPFKSYLAAPGRILVDDKLSNIQDWEAHGGTGVLHKGDMQDTLLRLNQAIDSFKAAGPKAPQLNP